MTGFAGYPSGVGTRFRTPRNACTPDKQCSPRTSASRRRRDTCSTHCGCELLGMGKRCPTTTHPPPGRAVDVVDVAMRKCVRCGEASEQDFRSPWACRGVNGRSMKCRGSDSFVVRQVCPEGRRMAHHERTCSAFLPGTSSMLRPSGLVRPYGLVSPSGLVRPLGPSRPLDTLRPFRPGNRFRPFRALGPLH